MMLLAFKVEGYSSVVLFFAGLAVEVGPDGALSVELLKTSAGLGFSLEGGKASAHGDRPLYIKRIFRGKHLSPVELLSSSRGGCCFQCITHHHIGKAKFL